MYNLLWLIICLFSRLASYCGSVCFLVRSALYLPGPRRWRALKRPVERPPQSKEPPLVTTCPSLGRAASTFSAMLWKVFAAAALLAQDAVAQNVNVGKLLRFACSQLVIERLDPIVQPETIPSSHTHQVVGGNSFNVTVTSTSPQMQLVGLANRI